jgi:uncharacterized protein (TIGR01244 family)
MSRSRRVTLGWIPVLACLTACSDSQDDALPAEKLPAGDPHGSGPPSAAQAPAVEPVPEIVEVEGMANSRRVGSDLLFGGQPSPEALTALAGRGYRTVVTTRGERELDWDERAMAESLGLTFVEIPMAYPLEAIRDEWVDRFDELMTGSARPMLVHCSSGNRVAGLWAVWLAEKRGVAPERALELGAAAGMTRIRPVVEKRLAGPTE